MTPPSATPRPRAPRKPPTRPPATDPTGTTGNPAGEPMREPAKPTATPARGLQGKLETLISSAALPFLLAGDTHCAGIVMNGAAPMAEAYAQLARENQTVNRFLTKMVEGGAVGACILTTLQVGLAIASHHGLRLPGPLGGFLGGTEPETNGAAPHMEWATTPPSSSPEGDPIPATRDPRNSGPGTDTPPVYVPGAPPGVVTVAASNANHRPGPGPVAA